MWGEHFAAELVAVCRKAPRKFKNQQISTRLVLCDERRASIVRAISFDRNTNLCVLVSCAFGSQLACISSQKNAMVGLCNKYIIGSAYILYKS